MVTRRSLPKVVRREPVPGRLLISNLDIEKGAQRALELALSELSVAFMNIVTDHNGKLPKGTRVRFSVEVVPRD